MSLDSRMNKFDRTQDPCEITDPEYLGLLQLYEQKTNGTLIECLDDGFVGLVDHMGDDAAIVQAARVSYGKGTKSVSDDRGLIRYLLRHYHTTPLEMVEFKFRVRAPMDCWRQWVRHRTASINEYSTRYSEAIDSAQEAEDWRTQSSVNKQGSGGLVTAWPEGYRTKYDMGMNGWIVLEKATKPDDEGEMLDEIKMNGLGCIVFDHEPTPADYLDRNELAIQLLSRGEYDERLKFGVAREQARKDLPLSTYTEAFWKIDLHNLFHFLRLRMDSHAQLEIRTFANAIYELIKPIVPAACEAFEDYRLNAMSFSGPEIEILRMLLTPHWMQNPKGLGKREGVELREKLDKIGISTAGLDALLAA